MSEPTATPYSVRIFLPDGDPQGLQIVLRSNWSGVGLVASRSVLRAAYPREEFDGPAVYVLEGLDEEGGLPQVYIGQTECLRERLKKHESEKDFWTRVIAFASKDGSLNAAFVRHLESRLVQAAKDAKRSQSENGNGPGRIPLSEADKADAEAFLDEILKIAPLVGLRIFEPSAKPLASREVYSMSPKGSRATGVETTGGFLVHRDSLANPTEVASIHTYLSRLRAQLQEEGVLEASTEGLRFTQDYAFGSPSTAAGVVAGRSANGRVEWKLPDGRTLRDVQSAASPNEPE